MRTIHVLFAACIALASGAASALGIESVSLHVDDGGAPGEAVEVFIPTDHVMHFDIALDETELGNHEFLVEFWAVDTTAGQDIKVSEFSSKALIANVINAKISLPRDWPIGLYRLDVKMDGEVVDSYEYEVAEPEE